MHVQNVCIFMHVNYIDLISMEFHTEVETQTLSPSIYIYISEISIDMSRECARSIQKQFILYMPKAGVLFSNSPK